MSMTDSNKPPNTLSEVITKAKDTLLSLEAYRAQLEAQIAEQQQEHDRLKQKLQKLVVAHTPKDNGNNHCSLCGYCPTCQSWGTHYHGLVTALRKELEGVK